MRNIKMTIEYDGKRYQGWQRLGDSDKTIQGKIENIIHQMTGEKLEIVGSGRTDAGTHAKGQVANFKTESDLSLDDMLNFFHQYLPQDIVVTQLEEMPDRFHSRYNAKGKQYSYYVWNQRIPSAFYKNYSMHVPEKLDMKKVELACEKLKGTHDFRGFSALKKTKKSTTRTITELSVKQEGAILHFTFVGDGFLHKMVRIMMGTLLDVGTGKMSLEDIDQVFDTKIRSNAGDTVPAQGLFLDEVFY